MKKMLTLVAGAVVIASSTMGVANAQGKASGPFADVPTDHWAYQSVEKLRDAGIVIGYPDGTYGGRRAMTRYEFATAIARLLALIPQNTVDQNAGNYALKSSLGAYALKSDIPSTAGFAKQSDLDALRAEVTRRLTADEAAIAALRDLVNQFAPELKKLGADVAAANARIDALDKRVAAVEAEQRRVVIHGDVNLITRSDINTNPSLANPIDKDGNAVGSKSKSLFNNVNVYHDILLTISGHVTDTAQAVIKIDAGNYLPWLGSGTEPNRPFGAFTPGSFNNIDTTPGASTFNIYEAYLATPVSLGPLGGASAVLGRQGIQFTPFTFKAIDPDSYTSMPETDTGNVIVDGGAVNFGVSSAHVAAFAGKTAPIQNFSISGNPTIPTANGALRPTGTLYGVNPIDQVAGARVTFGDPDKWTAGITGLLGRNPGGSTDPATGNPTTTLGVYGADFNGDLPFFGGHAISLDTEFAVDSTGAGSRFGTVNSDKGNEAWKALLGFHVGGIAFHAGYREIYNNFNAPGYWGKIGAWTNPSNIKGPEFSGIFGFSPKFSVSTEAQFYQGIYNLQNLSPLGANDKVNRANVGLKYGLSNSQTIDLGYEYVQWDLKNNQTVKTLANSGKPEEQYITIGYGQNLNKNTAVKLLYQIVDYKDKATGFGGGDSKGGVLVGQASVKF